MGLLASWCFFPSSFTTRFHKVVRLKKAPLLMNQYYHVKGALPLHKHGTLFFWARDIDSLSLAKLTAQQRDPGGGAPGGGLN